MQNTLSLSLAASRKAVDSGPPIDPGDALLLEIGDFILLETGDKLLLEA